MTKQVTYNDLQAAVDAMVKADKEYSNGNFSIGALTGMMFMLDQESMDTALKILQSNTAWLNLMNSKPAQGTVVENNTLFNGAR